ncbi:MAG: FtsX-like permease family protein [Verrucomicrobiales bacterium]
MDRLPFSFFLAWRYLSPKRSFLWAITLISLLGIVLGITVLILVISVMSGFEREIRRAVLQFDPHILIQTDGFMSDWWDTRDRLVELEEVTAAAPFMQGPVILQGPDVDGIVRRLAPQVRGIDPDMERELIDVEGFLVAGQYDLEGDMAVIGVRLAERINAKVGDMITVFSPGSLDAVFELLDQLESNPDDNETVDQLRELVLPTELIVSGIYETGRMLYDSEFVLVPLHIGQELYSLGDAVHGISLLTKNPYTVDLVREKIFEIDPELHATTWIDINRDRFEALRLERSVMFFILFFIVLVAAFGIMNTLITTTVQKTREIGVLKALGAKTGQITWVFLAQGVFLGLVGNVLGLACGMWLVTYRNNVRDLLSQVLNIQVFPQDIYELAQIPAEIIPSDIAVICGGAFVICVLAAWIPAFMASRLDPVKALRYE